jgi:purine-binding chemotaxis protein CheW
MIEEPAAARDASAADTRQTYILFTVAGTSYAVRSRHVLHIEMIEHVTPVPNAAPFVEGVVFSRGHVVPVINLRTRFGFARTAPDLRTRLLVVDNAGRRVGLMADDAREFITLDDSSIHPPGEAIGGMSGNYLQGVATIGGRIILILDVAEVVETTAVEAVTGAKDTLKSLQGE